MINAVLVVDGDVVSEPVHRFIEKSLSSNHYRISGILCIRPSHSIPSMASAALWALITSVDALALRHSNQFRSFAGTHKVSEYTTIRDKIRSTDARNELDGAMRHATWTHKPDILICLSNMPVTRTAASSPPLGAVTLTETDYDKKTSGALGLKETVHKRKSAGFSIRHFIGDDSHGRLLISGRVPVSPFYSINRISLETKGLAFMHQAIEQICIDRISPQCSEAGVPFPPLRKSISPKIWLQLRYALNSMIPATAGLLYQRIIRKRFSTKAQRWNVVYQFTNELEPDHSQPQQLITNPDRHYLADPVIWSENGRDICFVEDFDYDMMKGKITAYDIGTEKPHPLGTVLEEPFHLSFPFIFRFGNKTLMCPDTHGTNEIRLYECTSFPMQWTYHKTIKKNVSAVDTMLVEHQNRWWMLTNIDSSDLGEHCSELHLFHANRPDSETWTPHPSNPVVFTSEQARNAGLVKLGNTLYRAFQVHGFNQYGESLGISEILTMTPSRYEENPVTTLPPKTIHGSIGIHTISSCNGILAYDFLRHEKLE